MPRDNEDSVPSGHEGKARLVRVGAEIKRLRLEQGMTQTELGVKLGDLAADDPVPQVTVSRWELGNTSLTIEQIFSIEEVFKVRHGSLLVAGGYISPELGNVRGGKDATKDLMDAISTTPAIHDDYRSVVIPYMNVVLKDSAQKFREEESKRRNPPPPRRKPRPQE